MPRRPSSRSKGADVTDPPELDAHRRELEGWMLAWLEAAQLQAQRVRPSSDGTFADAQVDGMLFVVALDSAEVAAVAILGKDHPAIAEFRAALPHLGEMRDILLHFDDYVRGRGRLQKSGRVSAFRAFFSRDDETLTLHVCDRTLRVQDAFEAAVALHSATIKH